MKLSLLHLLLKTLFLSISILTFAQLAASQSYDGIEKSKMKGILKIVKDEVKKNYYDPTFRGIDLDARFKKAEEKLATATSTSQALAIIAQVLIDFNDSHLFFIPPSTTLAVEYGWRMTMYGDGCFVTAVKPGSDAEAKGLKVGDRILTISGFRPSRTELWKVQYYYHMISKRDSLTLSVVSPGEQTPRDLMIKSELKRRSGNITFETYFRLEDDFYEEENDKHRFREIGDIVVWKMPSFDYDPNQVHTLMDRVKSGRSLILDLRGNGGGLVETMEQLAGYFFEKDLTIAEMKGRKPKKPSVAKTRGKGGFSGKVVVLLDSESGSAAEIFGRLMQLEKRGVVLGDVSAGAVMQSIPHRTDMGADSVTSFAVSVTDADVIMSDGKSLEHVGVIPDELIVITGADLAAKRDPVMSRAIQLLGGNMSAEDAGKFFKYYWKKN